MGESWIFQDTGKRDLNGTPWHPLHPVGCQCTPYKPGSSMLQVYALQFWDGDALLGVI